MSRRLSSLLQTAREHDQGVMIVTIPKGGIRKIFCPYCGQPYTKHALHLEGAGMLHEQCRNRWCGTVTRDDGHAETVIYFETRDAELPVSR